MNILPRIELTEDGSQTLIHPLLKDSYHSTRGAVGEALHVFIKEGLHWIKGSVQTSCIKIFEVGFGSGLNAMLTAAEAERLDIRVEYHAVELYPVDFSIAMQLDYASDPVFRKIHEAKWGELIEINESFAIKKSEVSLLDYKFDTTFDLVYFDAFAPDTQSEMWSEDIFRRIYESMNISGTLVTYSSKGLVKQNLRSAGFEVKRLQGALGKRHMLRAVKV